MGEDVRITVIATCFEQARAARKPGDSFGASYTQPRTNTQQNFAQPAQQNYQAPRPQQSVPVQPATPPAQQQRQQPASQPAPPPPARPMQPLDNSRDGENTDIPAFLRRKRQSND
jgi:hypothetical protein